MNLRRGCRGCSGTTEARWIDDLAVEQVDTDGDGSLETTLYPITDLLGSVQLLTDDAGTPVERITYDPDGTPHFWSADTNRPAVTRIAWTGDGTMPTGDTVTPQAFEIGLSELCAAKNKSGRFGAGDDGRKEWFRATRRR